MTKRPSASFIQTCTHYLGYYATGSSHTARAKRLDLDCFTKFLQQVYKTSDPNKIKLSGVTLSTVQGFVEQRLTLGEAPATVARRLATLKHFSRVLSETIPGFVDPARAVRSPRLPMEKPKALSSQQIEKVKERATERKGEKSSFIRLRNETMLNLLLDTGLRAEEVRLLKRSQLDPKLEWLKGVRTKGKKYRNVYVTTAMRTQLKHYLERRQLELKRFFPTLSESKDTSLPLFISTYGAKPLKLETFFMGAKTLWRAINECSDEVKLHPHLLRHSYATELLQHSNDIRLVSQALGHSDVRVTMRYTERPDEMLARTLEELRRKKGTKSK